jgi:hypothetical protein
MTAQTARTLIARYTDDLPEEMLEEIVDFIQFIRYKRLHETPETLIRQDLQVLQQQAGARLEARFENLDEHYPKLRE